MKGQTVQLLFYIPHHTHVILSSAACLESIYTRAKVHVSLQPTAPIIVAIYMQGADTQIRARIPSPLLYPLGYSALLINSRIDCANSLTTKPDRGRVWPFPISKNSAASRSQVS